jgi:ankyrin repeat protein
MDTGFPPLAPISSFLRERIHEQAQTEGGLPSSFAGLVEALARLPMIQNCGCPSIGASAIPTPAALTMAIRNGLDGREFKMLLQHANSLDPGMVNVLDAQGSTPLTLAASKGDHLRIGLLFACCPDLDVNRPDKDGNTPLLLAAARGDYLITRRLLEAGADPTRENHERRSPLTMTLRRWNDQERERYSYTFAALLGVLKSMMDEGGPAKYPAMAVLRAASEKPYPNVRAEQASIIRLLT